MSEAYLEVRTRDTIHMRFIYYVDARTREKGILIKRLSFGL